MKKILQLTFAIMLASITLTFGQTTQSSPFIVNGLTAPTLRIQTSQAPDAYFTEIVSPYDGAQPFILKVGWDKLLGIKRIMHNKGNYISYINGRYGIGFTTETGEPDSTNLKMFIASNGNVGIGTFKPSQKLQVAGTISIAPISTSESRALNFMASDGSNAKYASIETNSTSGNLKIKSGGFNSGLGFSTSFFTDELERMRIAPNGNVGIGTLTPTAILEVNGTFNLGGVLKSNDYGIELAGSNNAPGMWFYGDRSYGLFLDKASNKTVYRVNNNDNAFVISSGSNVGIGTATPTAKLHVVGNSAIDGNLYVSGDFGNSAFLSFYKDRDPSNPYFSGLKYSNNAGWTWWKSTNSSIQINNIGNFNISKAADNADTTPATTMFNVTASSGNVGIGLPGPAGNKLEINGTGSGLRFTNLKSTSALTPSNTGKVLSVDANGDVVLVKDSVGTVSAGANAWAVNGANISRQSGNIGIGTVTPASLLDVNGNTQTKSLKVSDGSGANSVITYASNGTDLGYIGLAGAAGNLVNGSAVGDMILRTQSKNILFTVDGGTNPAMKIGSDGNVGVGTSTPLSGGLAAKWITANGNSYGGGLISSVGGVAKSAFYYENNRTVVQGNANIGIGFTVNSTVKAMDIDANGNVGIGTTTPSKKLTISESGASTIRLEAAQDPTSYSTEISNNWNATEPFSIKTGTTKIMGIKVLGAGLPYTYLNNYYGLAFSTGVQDPDSNSVRMFIKNNGNVGIGTRKPSAKLEVAGPANASGLRFTNLKSSNTLLSNYTGKVLSVDVNGDVVLVKDSVATVGAGANAWTVTGNNISNTNNGNVGIGTTSPANKFHVVGETRLDGNLYVAGPGDGTSFLSFFADRNKTNIYFGGFDYSNNSGWTVWKGFHNAIQINDNGYFDIRKAENSAAASTNLFRIAASTGNVGIGTETPTQKLDINGTTIIRNGNSSGEFVKDQLLFGWNNTPNFLHSIKTRHHSGVASGNAIDFYLWKQGVDAGDKVGTQHVMTMDGQGFVGIGTTTPTHKLSINGDALVGQESNGSGIIIRNNQTGVFKNDFLIAGKSDQTYLGNYQNLPIGIYTGNVERMRISADGNVGIGISTLPTGYKLAIAGDMIAERVVVKLQSSGWPDYVFTPTYHLSTLPEVEKFIEQNHHLPNVPSAKEVADKGIDVGAMNVKFMEKIEELTLYLIEQNKKLEALEKKNAELENAIKNIKK